MRIIKNSGMKVNEKSIISTIAKFLDPNLKILGVYILYTERGDSQPVSF